MKKRFIKHSLAQLRWLRFMKSFSSKFGFYGCQKATSTCFFLSFFFFFFWLAHSFNHTYTLFWMWLLNSAHRDIAVHWNSGSIYSSIFGLCTPNLYALIHTHLNSLLWGRFLLLSIQSGFLTWFDSSVCIFFALSFVQRHSFFGCLRGYKTFSHWNCFRHIITWLLAILVKNLEIEWNEIPFHFI